MMLNILVINNTTKLFALFLFYFCVFFPMSMFIWVMIALVIYRKKKKFTKVNIDYKWLSKNNKVLHNKHKELVAHIFSHKIQTAENTS